MRHDHTLCAPATRLLLLATMALALLSSTADAQTPPDEIKVTGIVRDFLSTHSDFAITPDRGYGHYAMNIGRKIAVDARPEFVGGGFNVSSQYLDRDDNPIPPHLYILARTIHLSTAPSISNDAVLDTWDSSLGPYGGSNVGPAPDIDSNAEMPEVEAPEMTVPFSGDVTYSGNGSSELATDLYCNNLLLNDGHTLRIKGNVTILCDANFRMKDDGSIRLDGPDAMLTLYVRGSILIQDSTVNSNTYEYWRITIISLEGQTIRIADGASMYANLIAPQSTVLMPDQSDFYGQITAAGLSASDEAGIHIDGSGIDMCNTVISDTEGASGGDSSGGITSSSTFHEWFHDSLDVNLSGQHTITLKRNGSGIYEYLDPAFFPIDDQLYGNEGSAHNYYFTFSFVLEFRYDQCQDLFVEFEGADDAWMFIGEDLAMDLGGVLPGTSQYVQVDRLKGLEDGEYYKLRFFYAQRNGSTASFNLRTNLPFVIEPPSMVVSGGFD